MISYRLSRLPDRALLGALSALVARDRATTAALLAHLAEVDARKLYLPAGYPSMFAYCVESLHFSACSAYKRIQAARTARQYPTLLVAVAEGRLHLSAVCLLASHLTPENVEALIAGAAHRRKDEIERGLGERFAPTLLVAAASAPAGSPSGSTERRLAPGPVVSGQPDAPARLAPGPVAPAAALAPHVIIRLIVPEATHAKLRHAQALLSHAVPFGDLAQVVDRALDGLIAQLERRKAAATQQPRPRPASRAQAKRTIPALVRRAVWRRDKGRCAFVSASGVRCSARWRLEFDHRDPVAHGGRASVERVRLVCRAHNQFEAERVFGAEFMRGKRARTPGTRAVPVGKSGTQRDPSHRVPAGDSPG